MNYTLKVILLTILSIMVLFAVGYGGYLLGNKEADKNAKTTPTPTATASIVKKVSTSPTATASSTLKSSATTTDSDENLIKQAVYENLGASESDTEVTIEKIEGNYAKGYSHGTTEEVGGGFFIAVKEGGSWRVVAAGNGFIECSVMEEYDVPATIVAECYDSSTGESKTR